MHGAALSVGSMIAFSVNLLAAMGSIAVSPARRHLDIGVGMNEYESTGVLMNIRPEEPRIAETAYTYDAGYGFYVEVVDDVMAAVLRQKTP